MVCSDQQIFLEDIRTPYGLVLYGNFLYFAEESFIEGTNAVIYEVQRINKTDPAHREVVIGNLYRLRDIKVYHRNRAMLSEQNINACIKIVAAVRSLAE